MTIRILQGDCREVLKTLPDQSVHMVCTSPPYLGLREYGTATWEGGDAACDHVTPTNKGPSQNKGGAAQANGHGPRLGGNCPKCGALRVDQQIGLEPTPAKYVAELVAVFRELWRVLRDDGTVWLNLGDSYNAGRNGGHPGGKNSGFQQVDERYVGRSGVNVPGFKPKDLIMIPARVAIALQDDGWWIRSDVIWHKPNP
ncbi:MAG TPA: DNA methyltransferase, partial [Rhodopila sp.]